jgi:hypothetical protein
MRRFTAAALFVLPLAVHAQQTEHVVSPGMTRAQVVAALGAPSTQRTASEYTYMFYPNACGRSCGMNDLVILRHDSVSDAIFRSPNRRYTGTSSSPQEVAPETSPRASRPAPKPMAIRKDDAAAKPAVNPNLKPPAKGNDVTPSIPTNVKPLAPAAPPAKTTAPARTPAPDKKTPG